MVLKKTAFDSNFDQSTYFCSFFLMDTKIGKLRRKATTCITKLGQNMNVILDSILKGERVGWWCIVEILFPSTAGICGKPFPSQSPSNLNLVIL